MKTRVETLTPPNTPKPIGPYSHIAKVGSHITIGGTAGFDPATGKMTGPDIRSQTLRILQSCKVMLEAVGSDLNHVVHVNVFLRDMKDFEAMNAAYVDVMGEHRPARTAIAVRDLPKPEDVADDESHRGDAGGVSATPASIPRQRSPSPTSRSPPLSAFRNPTVSPAAARRRALPAASSARDQRWRH